MLSAKPEASHVLLRAALSGSLGCRVCLALTPLPELPPDRVSHPCHWHPPWNVFVTEMRQRAPQEFRPIKMRNRFTILRVILAQGAMLIFSVSIPIFRMYCVSKYTPMEVLPPIYNPSARQTLSPWFRPAEGSVLGKTHMAPPPFTGQEATCGLIRFLTFIILKKEVAGS